MTFTDWLDQESGRLASMAAHFKVTQSAITQWRTDGVPMVRMRAVRDFTGGVVTLEEMLEQRESIRSTPATQEAA